MKKFLFVLFLFPICNGFSQSDPIFDEVKINDSELSSQDNVRLKSIKKHFKQHSFVKVNKLSKAIKKNKLKLKDPATGKKFEVNTKFIDFLDDGNFDYYGEIYDENQGIYGSFLLKAENGSYLGEFSINDDFYTLSDFEKNKKNILLLHNKTEKDCLTPTTDITSDKINSDYTSRSCTNTVDILFLFTPGANSTENPLTSASRFITEFNTALRNSAVSTSQMVARSVGVIPVGYDVTQDQFATQRLNTLKDEASTPGDNIFEERKSRKADLVIMLDDENWTFQAAGGGFGRANGAILGLAETWQKGVGFVNITTSDFVFSHEMGHAFGANHDGPTLRIDRPFLFRNLFYRNFGTLEETSAWHNRILYFSNPDVRVYRVFDIGVENERDNTRKMQSNMCKVSTFSNNFAPPNIEFGASITGPVNVNNSDFFTWCASYSNCSSVSTKWYYSFDGITYYYLSSSTCINSNQLDLSGTQIYLRLQGLCSNGVTKTITKLVNIDDTIFKPHPDNDQEDLTTMDGTKSELAIQIIPNPVLAESHIYIDSHEKISTNLQIVDNEGRVIKNIDLLLNEGKNIIPLKLDSRNRKGLYHVILTGNDSVISKTFMKEND